jgi:hypothetical protein
MEPSFFQQATNWVATHAGETQKTPKGFLTIIGSHHVLVQADIKMGKYIAILNGKRIGAYITSSAAYQAGRDKLILQVEKELKKSFGYKDVPDSPNFVADYFTHLDKHGL